MNDNHVAVANGANGTSPTQVLDGFDPDVVTALQHLARSFPTHAGAIAQSGRLASGLAALQAATGLSGPAMAAEVGARELASANRPVDVLMSRCMSAIQQHGETSSAVDATPDHAAPTANGSTIPVREATTAGASVQDTSRGDTAPGDTAPGDTAPGDSPPMPIDSVPTTFDVVVATSPVPWWQRRRRPSASITPPTIAGPYAEAVAATLIGNRYLGVVAAVGGAGASTLSVLLGQVLATCRSDRLVVADAAPLPGGVAARSGVNADGALRHLLASEDRIYGCAEVSRFVGRTPSRLDVAGLGLDDEPLSPDEYRRAAALLARFYDVMVTDVGAGTSSATATPALALADVAIVVTNPTVHGVRSVERTLSWLRRTERNVNAERVVIVVNGAQRRSSVDCEAVMASLTGHCASVMTLPWDPHLASGEAVDLRALHPATLGATTALAATLVGQLRNDE
jgi:MinD-like ATPase involved in chromosome partitioning or flagellar assembly